MKNSNAELYALPLIHEEPGPMHESWVRISTRSNMVGLFAFIVLAAVFVYCVNLHLRRGEIAALLLLGATAGVLTTLWLAWTTTPLRHRGRAGNAILTARIKAELCAEMNLVNIDVDSVGDTVTLSGTIPYADFSDAAIGIARRSGARTVIDRMSLKMRVLLPEDSVSQCYSRVSTPEGAPLVGTPIEELAIEALQDDPRVNANLISVRVVEGIACLAGRQDTTDASEAATESVLRVGGILGVSNEIEITPSV